VLNIDDQYLFGPSLLINPVCEYKQRSRKLYLPKTTGWYDFYSGKWYAGGQTITADAPYERMPVFVKEGSIIPFGPELQYVSEKPADTIVLNVYTGKKASFNLYEDEGTNYNYEKGAYATIPISYNETTKTITIGDRTGSFNGMLAQRVFRINAISPGKTKTLDFDAGEKRVIYTGKKITIKL
jgi:alpha-D-xyloside xylohydrolase